VTKFAKLVATGLLPQPGGFEGVGAVAEEFHLAQLTETEDCTSLRKLLDDCATLAREYQIAESGDLVAITAGLSAQGVCTNPLEIHRVP